MRMEAYLAELGLTERVLYDAQGNSFDPPAVMIRMGEGIRQWSHGEGPPRHTYEAPSRVQLVFRTIRNYTRERGLPAVESPCPYDIRGDLLADRDGVEPAFLDTPRAEGVEGAVASGGSVAAGDGRGGR